MKLNAKTITRAKAVTAANMLLDIADHQRFDKLDDELASAYELASYAIASKFGLHRNTEYIPCWE